MGPGVVVRVQDANRYPDCIRGSISVECRSFKTPSLDILPSFLQHLFLLGSCGPLLSPCPLVGIGERNVFVCVFVCVQHQLRTPAGSSLFRSLRNETFEEVKKTQMAGTRVVCLYLSYK